MNNNSILSPSALSQIAILGINSDKSETFNSILNTVVSSVTKFNTEDKLGFYFSDNMDTSKSLAEENVVRRTFLLN